MHILNSYDEFLPILSKANLLNNIPQDQYKEVFDFLGASVRHYEKGEYIQRLGEPLIYSGIVLDGTVEGSFISENYNKIKMNHFTTGRSFGDALACVKTSHSPIQLKALTDCKVLLIHLSKLLEYAPGSAGVALKAEAAPGSAAIESASPIDFKAGAEAAPGSAPIESASPIADAQSFVHFQTLSTNLIRILASQNVFSNLKLRISNQRALRDKILIYLHSLPQDAKGFIQVPFTQTALAEFLGVNRSALSRELGKMQDEGLLEIVGKKFRLI